MEIEAVKNATPRHSHTAKGPEENLRESNCLPEFLEDCGLVRHDAVGFKQRPESIPQLVWSHVD